MDPHFLGQEASATHWWALGGHFPLSSGMELSHPECLPPWPNFVEGNRTTTLVGTHARPPGLQMVLADTARGGGRGPAAGGDSTPSSAPRMERGGTGGATRLRIGNQKLRATAGPAQLHRLVVRVTCSIPPARGACDTLNSTSSWCV